MNEAETRAELIDPALTTAGWGVVAESRIRREHIITKGRLQGGGGQRSKRDIADYILTYREKNLAVVEAKREDLGDTEGLAQAKRYAEKMGIRFAYSTNGRKVYRVDMETGDEGYVPGYPTPAELWDVHYPETNDWRERFGAVPFEDGGGAWEPRYYQHRAIDAVLEGLAAGQDRMLLTLATGTGKTSIAFQIVWKLFQSRWNLRDWKQGFEPTRRPRILFLADRNILANQAFNAFHAFEEGACVRIKPDEIRKRGSVPKNGSVFFTIFQTFMSGRKEDGTREPYFGQYPKDFFDCIIIDECHRGGANDESDWRGILEYFSPAVQLGLTATPRRDDNADTYAYFGEPVYVYSLKEGVEDGFLTPFRVRQYSTTIDEYEYTSDDTIEEGEIESGKQYTEKDFNRTIVIPERELYRVQTFMDFIEQREKTLIFCRTQAHALMVRDAVNRLKKSTDPNYCERVTANDGAEGEAFLKKFQDNENTIPTILTTSQKLSTGVDAQNVRHIVLLRPVRSMIEFKQIIGRGTRLFEGKDYFTIHDFTKAHQLFKDPAWDGEPLSEDDIEDGEAGDIGGEGLSPDVEDDAPEEGDGEPGTSGGPARPRMRPVVVRLADGKVRRLQHMVHTAFYGPDGKIMSAQEFVEHLFGELPAHFQSEEELRRIWSRPETRRRLLEDLGERGYGQEALAKIGQVIDAEKSDLYDVLAYIAFALAPLSREDRVNANRERIYLEYKDPHRAFIDFVLEHYVKEGVSELDDEKLPHLLQLKYQGIDDAVEQLGEAGEIRRVFTNFQHHLYVKAI